MNFLPLRTIACLLSLSFIQTGLAQQWPLGHQPAQYSVPQYKPAEGGSYPLIQKPAAPQQSQQHEPDARQDSETAPGSLPDWSQSYPLQGTSPGETAQPVQPMTPATKLPQDSVERATPPDTSKSVVPSENFAASNPGRFGFDYSIYRDRNHYPIDPRKPCNECIRPHISEACKCQWPGKNGRPYQDREPGACSCSCASHKNKPNFSYNWPAPFSATLKTHLSSGSNRTSSRRRINDCFDHLVDFKLIDYQRTDNGYCGNGADPYGCLGESRVAGVGFRQPGDAIQR